MKKVIALSAAIFCLLIFKTSAQQVPVQRSINVTGVAEMEVIPDEIFVHVVLSEYDKKGVGKINIENIKKNFLKAAVSLGIADSNIVVQGFQGYDNNYLWWYRNNKKKNPDMKASITYQVKLNSSKKMDELVAKLDDEATQNFYIASVSHSNKEMIRKQLKIQAIRAAKEKAEYLAEAIAEKSGKAITINEPSEMSFQPQMISNSMIRTQEFEGDAAGAPEVNFKKIKYQFEVNVTFALQ